MTDMEIQSLTYRRRKNKKTATISSVDNNWRIKASQESHPYNSLQTVKKLHVTVVSQHNIKTMKNDLKGDNFSNLSTEEDIKTK